MKFKNAKMTTVSSKNPFPTIKLLQQQRQFSLFCCEKQQRIGPQGQTSRMQD